MFNTLKKFHRTVLIDSSDLLQNNCVKNTHLSLDHINTGTGMEVSAPKHTKSEIKLPQNKREDEAAILEHSPKARDLHYVIGASADQIWSQWRLS